MLEFLSKKGVQSRDALASPPEHQKSARTRETHQSKGEALNSPALARRKEMLNKTRVFRGLSIFLSGKDYRRLTKATFSLEPSEAKRQWG